METTGALMEALRGFAAPGRENKFFAQVFQALRIAVNDEMGALEEFLAQTPDLLVAGGRLSVISYHSLEDRLVKNFIRARTFFRGTGKGFLRQRDRSVAGCPPKGDRAFARRDRGQFPGAQRQIACSGKNGNNRTMNPMNYLARLIRGDYFTGRMWKATALGGGHRLCDGVQFGLDGPKGVPFEEIVRAKERAGHRIRGNTV